MKTTLTQNQVNDLEVAVRLRLEASTENNDKGAIRRWQQLHDKIEPLMILNQPVTLETTGRGH